MSEYVGEVFVKVTPDTKGFSSQLQQQIKAQPASTQGILQRTGLDKSLQGYDKASRDLIATQKELAAAEALAAVQAKNLGNAHDGLAIHAHRASIAGLGVRASTVGAGIALLAGVEAAREFGRQLQVTGSEAGTTEGRIRNLGAALITGDIVGGLKALTVGFTLSANSLNDLQNQIARADLSKLKILAELANATGNSELRKQLQQAQFGVRANIKSDQATQAGLTPGLSDDLRVAKDAEREAQIGLRVYQRGTLEYSKALAGYVKAVQDRRAIQQQFNDATGKQASLDLQIAQARSATGPGAQSGLLGALKADKDYLQNRIKGVQDAGQNTIASRATLTGLYKSLDSVNTEITSIEKAAAEKQKQALQDRISIAQDVANTAIAQARTTGQENAALAQEARTLQGIASEKKTDAKTRAQLQLSAAQAEKQIFENNKQEADRRKQEAARQKQLYKDSIAVLDQKLQTQLQLAQLTEHNTKDDLKILHKQTAFYKLESENTKLDAGTRANYASQEVQAEAAIHQIEKQRRDNLTSLREQKLGIQLQLAQLTKHNLNDDKKAIKAQIAFYHAQSLDRKNLTDAQRLAARSNELSARQSLKDLKPEAPRSSASDFFREAASQFTSFGSNIASKGGILSGQDARASFAARALSGAGLQNAKDQNAQQTRNAQLAEAQKHTVLLKKIATRLTYGGAEGDPPPKAIGKARRGAHVVQAAK